VLTTHCAFLTRHALTARTKQCGLTFALPSQNCALILAYFNVASSRTCLRRPRWATRDASSLHKRENHNLRCCRLIPEMVEKEGGFRHQHGPMMARLILADNPKRGTKLAAYLDRASSAGPSIRNRMDGSHPANILFGNTLEVKMFAEPFHR